jgi:polar amino acid transport system permease protein
MADLAGWWDDYFFGAIVVLKVFVVSLILATLFGLIGSSMKLSKSKIANKIADIYTVIFRGTPELVVLLLIYFGAATFVTSIAQLFDPSIKYVDVPAFWSGSFAIGLIVGAYMTETFRGAFLGVDGGTLEASRALGISNFNTFIYIRVPQMWRLVLPNFGNHMLSLMKDTALISIIGLEEIFFVAKLAITNTSKPFTMYIVVALFYLAMTTVITLIVVALERHANRYLETGR